MSKPKIFIVEDLSDMKFIAKWCSKRIIFFKGIHLARKEKKAKEEAFQYQMKIYGLVEIEEAGA